jgi:hypothetical protein
VAEGRGRAECLRDEVFHVFKLFSFLTMRQNELSLDPGEVACLRRTVKEQEVTSVVLGHKLIYAIASKPYLLHLRCIK